MFKKILIAEDIDSISLGITSLLEKNFNTELHTVKYCDEAYQLIKKGIQEKAPYGLVITDLSFKDDPMHDAEMRSGEDLISKLREENIPIRIIVYTVEDKNHLIRHLFNDKNINGFVAKGRESNTELIEAVKAVHKGDLYISHDFANILREQPVIELDKYDIEVLKMLSEGLTQEDISRVFRKNDYPSPSTSSIEKKINRLKFIFKVQNSIHLIATAKDMRLI